MADLRIAEQEDKRGEKVVEVSEAVFHDHVLEDGVVGVEGHLGGDQASEVGGQAEEGEQREHRKPRKDKEKTRKAEEGTQTPRR